MQCLGRDKVVVFGGSGFLGSHVADCLSDHGYDVTIYDIKPSPYLRENQRMVIGNILNRKKVMEVLKDAKYAYNFAGIAEIHEASRKPIETIKHNVLGHTIILDACVKNSVDRILFASSIYVYGKHGSFYRVSKQACELLCEAYQETYGLDYTILRYGSLYGPRAQKWNGIFHYLYQAIVKGRIDYPGTGEERREYIHVFDAARMSVEVLDEKYRNQYVILTGNQSYTSKELLTMIKEMCNGKIEINLLSERPKDHYVITPYTFSPKLGVKLISNPSIDMGQGLLQMMEEIYKRYCIMKKEIKELKNINRRPLKSLVSKNIKQKIRKKSE